MYLRTECLLLERETFSEVECAVVPHVAYWLKANELKLTIEVIPVLILNIIILVLLFNLI